MVRITINGEKTQVPEGWTILQAAKKMNIPIPTLCCREMVSPYGACRICLVEIVDGEKLMISTSCNYPVHEAMLVNTDSSRVLKARQMMVEFLLFECPNSQELWDLAKEMGLEKPRFNTPRFKPVDKNCILCGLCVRACELVGVNAISFVNRGTHREVTTPFKMASDACVGCGGCAFICPIGAIKIEDKDDKRLLENWKTELRLNKCKACGSPFAPEIELRLLQEKLKNLAPEFLQLCSDCRRKNVSNKVKTLKTGPGRAYLALSSLSSPR